MIARFGHAGRGQGGYLFAAQREPPAPCFTLHVPLRLSRRHPQSGFILSRASSRRRGHFGACRYASVQRDGEWRAN